MRAFYVCGLVALLTGLGVVACNPNSIGRPCVNPAASQPEGTQLVSPALECPSRLCLLTTGALEGQDGGTRQTCTDSCESNDDCEAESLAQCKNGFVCAVANTTGKYACKRVCICRDDLDVKSNAIAEEDGGVRV